MDLTLSDFAVKALLTDIGTVHEYLSQVLVEGDNEELIRAIEYVMQACSDLQKEQSLAQT
ncbi:transcriptional regulator [Pseudomonas koreensis]|uniref:Transcriptional regulator n=1 Tax=Pseudomonas koreensis TaxID=198620 RepID=A0A9X3BEL1_9PSED|nr:transcriptional regulator [Pseudomonas koreensis]MCU7251870.1 transcriptional regulator [Pseudomonas koreensis]